MPMPTMNLLVHQSITERRRNYPHTGRNILRGNSARPETVAVITAIRSAWIVSSVLSGSRAEGCKGIGWGLVWRGFTRGCSLLGLPALLRLHSLAWRQRRCVGQGQFGNICGGIATHTQVLKFNTGCAVREVKRHPARGNIDDGILAVAVYAGSRVWPRPDHYRLTTPVGQYNPVAVTDAGGAHQSKFRR